MRRTPIMPFSACLLALTAAAVPGAAAADPVLDYSVHAGRSTNLFEDTNKLSGAFVEAEAKLRGSIDIDGSDISYALWHREKRLSQYRFGDEHATGGTLGYKTKLGDAVDFAIEGNLSRTQTGDVLLAVPGTVIGYRTVDWNYGGTAALGAEFFGGKNTLTASLNRIEHSKATFTTNLLLPSKLKADVKTFDLSIGHIRPALSGELGFTVAYQATYVPFSEQTTLLRLPASKLRGSVAYGRQLSETLTIIAELGATGIMSDRLGSEVKRVRPYLHTAVEWKPVDPLSLGIGYDRDFAIADPDDPLGEYVDTWKFATAVKLAPRLEARASYEIASSEWIYYLYHTRTKRFTGTLAFEFAKDHKLELEYRHIDRREKDEGENFVGSQYFARVSGTF